MNKMENKKDILEQLKKRNEELKPKIFKDYKTVKELNNYRNKNITIFQEYNSNQEQIEQLEYDLMSPEEQEKWKKRDRFLELKAKGEPFDLSEFEDLND